MVKYIKEKVLEGFGSFSGITSLFGSWQICHSICLGLVALLSVIGISVTGLPLFFLNKYAILLWGIAFGLLIITIAVYFIKKCISKKLILFNTGLIIIGIPFQVLQPYTKFFWLIGGILIMIAVTLFIKDRLGGNKK